MTSRSRAGEPGEPVPDAATGGALVEGKRTLCQGLPVQRKTSSPASSAPAATPGNAAPVTDDPYAFHLPVQRKPQLGAGSKAENECLTERDKDLPPGDAPDTDRLEINDGKAAYTPTFDDDGKLTSIAKRYHDKFNNMSVVVTIKVDPPRKVSEAKAKAKIDELANATYRKWLAERVDVISQLCAQRRPLEIEERLDLGDEPDVTPEKPPKPDAPRPDQPRPDAPPKPDPGGPSTAPASSSTTVVVLFAHGSHTPLDLAGVIASVRATHEKRPNATILLDGHASAPGSDKFNLELSRKRVASVRQALRAIEGLNIPPRDGEAHGEAEAHAGGRDGDTDAPHRRVDIRFVD